MKTLTFGGWYDSYIRELGVGIREGLKKIFSEESI